MAAKRKVGHVAPDKTKRYAVIDLPTVGAKKNAGVPTRIYGADLSWDEAHALKSKASTSAKVKFATIVDHDRFNTLFDALSEETRTALAADYYKRNPGELKDAEPSELAPPLVDAVPAMVANSSLANAWPTEGTDAQVDEVEAREREKQTITPADVGKVDDLFADVREPDA